MPENVNYGHVGFIVGHEMSHGFDPLGIFFGKNGNTRLSQNVLKKYYQRVRCFVDQFDNYFDVKKALKKKRVKLPYYDLGLSRGSKTKIENVADSMGLRAVFRAYKNLKDTKKSDEPKLPGLEEFTDEQLFLISFGSYWCDIKTTEFEKWDGDMHSPGNLRVIGALANNNDFAEAFDCPIGSPMNPSDKCNIWRKSDAARKIIQARRSSEKSRHGLDQSNS